MGDVVPPAPQAMEARLAKSGGPGQRVSSYWDWLPKVKEGEPCAAKQTANPLNKTLTPQPEVPEVPVVVRAITLKISIVLFRAKFPTGGHCLVGPGRPSLPLSCRGCVQTAMN